MPDQLSLTAPVSKGAGFSPCRTYRYHLWRTWGTGPTLLGIGVNPSKAGEIDDDPTVVRLSIRGQRLGFGRLVIGNLNAYVATDPADLKRARKAGVDVVGPGNDKVLLREAIAADMVLCMWGVNGTIGGRDGQVVQMLRGSGIVLHCLRLTKAGSPEHPLYLPYELKPQPWAGA